MLCVGLGVTALPGVELVADWRARLNRDTRSVALYADDEALYIGAAREIRALAPLAEIWRTTAAPPLASAAALPLVPFKTCTEAEMAFCDPGPAAGDYSMLAVAQRQRFKATGGHAALEAEARAWLRDFIDRVPHPVGETKLAYFYRWRDAWAARLMDDKQARLVALKTEMDRLMLRLDVAKQVLLRQLVPSVVEVLPNVGEITLREIGPAAREANAKRYLELEKAYNELLTVDAFTLLRKEL